MASDSNGEEVDTQPKPQQALARGGPIYFSNTVGSLVHPHAFKNHILYELQALQLEFSSCPNDQCSPDDICVDDLKVFSDEELVDLAFQKAFKENEDDYGNKPKKRRIGNPKFKRRKKEDADEGYLARVDDVVNLKLKQDEDRDFSKLLLRSGNTTKNDGRIASVEGFERFKTLMSSDSIKRLPKLSEFSDKIPHHLQETILCVEVHDSKRCGYKVQEFVVLGSHFLTVIKDLISCTTDVIAKKTERHNSSGYFLVEDVFYNDMRGPKAIDYSEPILEWLQNSSGEAMEKWTAIISGEMKKKQKEVVGDVAVPRVPSFSRALMQKTRFRDVKFRMGAGYVYCHNGDCRHAIVFRDMRMIDGDDEQNAASYPMLFEKRWRMAKCNVCGIYKATRMTVNDKWAKFNPCYFCDGCYFYLHYRDDGSLLYNEFSVYNCH